MIHLAQCLEFLKRSLFAPLRHFSVVLIACFPELGALRFGHAGAYAAPARSFRRACKLLGGPPHQLNRVQAGLFQVREDFFRTAGQLTVAVRNNPDAYPLDVIHPPGSPRFRRRHHRTRHGGGGSGPVNPFLGNQHLNAP